MEIFFVNTLPFCRKRLKALTFAFYFPENKGGWLYVIESNKNFAIVKTAFLRGMTKLDV
jgi:hypothetical protein